MVDSLKSIPPSLYGSIPAAEPPPGVQPNFSNPVDDGPKLVVAASVFMALTTIVALGRAYTKKFIIGKWTWDDRMPV